jgi:hypothetical protein
MSHSQAVLLSGLEPRPTPIVRLIDDWFTNRPLGLIFEVAVGEGRLIISGIDLLTDRETRPEARQLLYSLVKYLSRNELGSVPEVGIDMLHGLFKE